MKEVMTYGVAYENPKGYADSVSCQELNKKDEEQMTQRPLVYICSPFSGDVEGNQQKARQYSRVAVEQGAIPIAPHLLLPQFMKEETERELAMTMDIAILSRCDELWVFGDKHSVGMQKEIAYAKRSQIPIRFISEKEVAVCI